MNNLFVVDGSALLNILFYGSISDVNKAVKLSGQDLDTLNAIIDGYFRKGHGHYTENVGSFIRTVLTMAKDLKAESVVVLFDKNSETTFRKKMYPQYKANREEKPAAIKDQALVLHCVLNKIGIKCYWADEFEADDLAGSIIKRFKSQFDNVYFYTKDKDWLQLLSGNVKGIMPQASLEEAKALRDYYGEQVPENNIFEKDGPQAKGKNLCITEDMCKEIYGVYPEQVPDLKGLSGDKADNIPGVNGIGEDTAKKLLEIFGSIDNIYKALNGWKLQTTDYFDALLATKSTMADAIKAANKKEVKEAIKPYKTIQDMVDNKEEIVENILKAGFKNEVKALIKRCPYFAIRTGKKDAEFSRNLATICQDIPINYPKEALKMDFNMNNIVMAIKLYNLEDDLDNCFR